MFCNMNTVSIPANSISNFSIMVSKFSRRVVCTKEKWISLEKMNSTLIQTPIKYVKEKSQYQWNETNKEMIISKYFSSMAKKIRTQHLNWKRKLKYINLF